MPSDEDDDLTADELPWQTAPEFAAEIADDVGVTEAVKSHAVEMATDHGLHGDLASTPRVIGASAVYLCSLLHNEKVTQPAIMEAGDVSDMAIRETYQMLGELEGIDMGNGDSEADGEPEPEPPSYSPTPETSDTEVAVAVEDGDDDSRLVSLPNLSRFGVPAVSIVVVSAVTIGVSSLLSVHSISAEFTTASEEVMTTGDPAITMTTVVIFAVIFAVSFAITQFAEKEVSG